MYSSNVGIPGAFHLSHAAELSTSKMLAQMGKDGEQCDIRPLIYRENKKDWPARAVVRITQPCVSSVSAAPYTVGCARFNVGFIVGFQNEISGLVCRVYTSSCTCRWISGGRENIYLISSQIPPVAGFNVLVFVLGKVIVVSSVLGPLPALPEMLVEDLDRGATIETVLHLPEGVDNDPPRRVAGIAFDTIGLCLKSIADQYSNVGESYSVNTDEVFPVVEKT